MNLNGILLTDYLIGRIIIGFTSTNLYNFPNSFSAGLFSLAYHFRLYQNTFHNTSLICENIISLEPRFPEKHALKLAFPLTHIHFSLHALCKSPLEILSFPHPPNCLRSCGQRIYFLNRKNVLLNNSYIHT